MKRKRTSSALSEVDTKREEEEEEVSAPYDGLLSSLKSSCKAFAQAFNKREREEQGLSSDADDDDGEDEGSESEDDVDGDTGSHSGEEDQIEGEEEENDAEFTNTMRESSEDEDDSGDDGEGPRSGVSQRKIAFHLHLTHTLSESDVQRLNEGKQKFRVEFPAHGIPMCKWVATDGNDSFGKESNSLSSYGIKSRLLKHWQAISDKREYGDFVSPKQCQFFSLCNSYQDVLHSDKNSFLSGGQDDDSIFMDAYILHTLNHVYETRDLVMKNNTKLNKQANHEMEQTNTFELPRDQGFTRPKVLIMLPFRSIAAKVVRCLIKLSPSPCKANIEFLDRFLQEFGDEDDKDEKSTNGKLKIENVEKSRPSSKPVDYKALFGGNNDDHFRIGIKITKKSIKLYSDFYSSDIIIASPIGLITKIGEAEFEKNKDVDFLSSIEVLVIDFADVILMQNWSHVVSVVHQLNQIPTKQHGTDFMRIREWYLNGQAQYFRQTIILSNFVNAEINSLFNRSCKNYRGKLKSVSSFNGVLPKVLRQVRQIYERFDCDSVLDNDDKRFEFFVKKVFPKIKDSLQGGIMLFTSSYFEFVRLRNFLKSQSASFCLLGEYTKQSDISRAKSWFFHGKRKIMLYTERAHFYHRYKIRGIHDLIFYSLPERSDFYAEIMNMIEGMENPSCTVLFSCYDNLRLERIVGTSFTKKMLSSAKKMFMFC